MTGESPPKNTPVMGSPTEITAARSGLVPTSLLNSVKEGKSILFLGAMASAASARPAPLNYTIAPPSGNTLSRLLALQCTYPYRDDENLQRVALYFQYSDNQNRGTLIQAMQREICAPGVVPSPALRMLADLPFPIIITTNYDNLFDTALWGAHTLTNVQKRPAIRVYRPGLDDRPEGLPLEDPSEEKPILLKLHGSFDKPDSVVVTEDDYLNFVQKMSGGDRTHPVHLSIREKLLKWPVLFIGYSLRDYNFRLLIRTLRWNVDEADWRLHFSVDPKPDGVIALVSRREPRSRVNFIEADLWDFVPELYNAVKGGAYK